jgi:hypothetical protein
MGRSSCASALCHRPVLDAARARRHTILCGLLLGHHLFGRWLWWGRHGLLDEVSYHHMAKKPVGSRTESSALLVSTPMVVLFSSTSVGDYVRIR